MSKVVLFSTPACSWCRRTKRYFRERRVPYKEVNLKRDPESAEDALNHLLNRLRTLGFTGRVAVEDAIESGP